MKSETEEIFFCPRLYFAPLLWVPMSPNCFPWHLSALATSSTLPRCFLAFVLKVIYVALTKQFVLFFWKTSKFKSFLKLTLKQNVWVWFFSSRPNCSAMIWTRLKMLLIHSKLKREYILCRVGGGGRGSTDLVEQCFHLLSIIFWKYQFDSIKSFQGVGCLWWGTTTWLRTEARWFHLFQYFIKFLLGTIWKWRWENMYTYDHFWWSDSNTFSLFLMLPLQLCPVLTLWPLFDIDKWVFEQRPMRQWSLPSGISFPNFEPGSQI